ncbi:rhomboid family intramembrane serine protease [Streptococcus caprae]|uniref:Rhomboid family intramembrane serine protease n=1 Tax=Streptococcus caprae TaxID=1640501 RepID=A0ABV8CU51_9STRE
MMKNDFRRYPATWGILIVTALVFVGMFLIFQGQMTTSWAVYLSGGMLGEAVKLDPTQLWRLVSPIFVHIGFEHILMNGISIYFAGRMAEQIFGWRRFLVLYLLAGVFGNALTLFFTPDVVSAGASTSIFGLFAAIAILGYFGHNRYLQEAGRTFTVLIVLNLMTNIFSPNVSLVGHLGGALGGAILALAIPSRVEPNLFTKQKRGLAWLAYLAVIVVMVGVPIWLT